jgi:hypothetical protein
MALELALDDPAYEDMASKFFEHFVAISGAISGPRALDGCHGLWHEEDGFYYDHLRLPSGQSLPLRIRSMVGLVPLFSCLVLDREVLDLLPAFKKRLDWFLTYRPELATQISYMTCKDCTADVRQYSPSAAAAITSMPDVRHLLAIPSRDRLVKVLSYVLDEKEFLSPYGVRSLSKYHDEHPYVFSVPGEQEYRVQYVPGESDTYLFGGNSNWRGPVWVPVNWLLIEVLERYYYFYGNDLQVECPTGSGVLMNLKEVSKELAGRLERLFLPDENGRRPCHSDSQPYASDPHWRDLVLFYEYFHGENGKGLGASHQTGWTALVANCIYKTSMS